MIKKYRHIILFLLLLLASCGVKRVAVPSQEPAVEKVDQVAETVAEQLVENASNGALSLEYRIAAGEFAWLDTIQIDTASVWMKYYSGYYVLEHQNDLDGNKVPYHSILADSLVMKSSGYYWKYKKDSLVDYGRFRVQNHAKQMICWEQRKVDFAKGILTDELEQHPIEMESSFVDCFSYDESCHRYWVRCNHGDNSFVSRINSRQQLIILMDVDKDCFRSHCRGCNEREWVIRK